VHSHVYDVPEALLGVPLSACRQDMYYTELLLPTLARQSRRYATTAAKANLFWIPHRSTCQYHACLDRHQYAGTGADAADAAVPTACKAEVAATLDGIWRHVAHGAPHWNASSGTDHVLVFAWDAASELLGAHPVRARVQPAIHLTHYGTVRCGPFRRAAEGRLCTDSLSLSLVDVVVGAGCG
jgi:hypothetical protein